MINDKLGAPANLYLQIERRILEARRRNASEREVNTLLDSQRKMRKSIPPEELRKVDELVRAMRERESGR